MRNARSHQATEIGMIVITFSPFLIFFRTTFKSYTYTMSHRPIIITNPLFTATLCASPECGCRTGGSRSNVLCVSLRLIKHCEHRKQSTICLTVPSLSPGRSSPVCIRKLWTWDRCYHTYDTISFSCDEVWPSMCVSPEKTTCIQDSSELFLIWNCFWDIEYPDNDRPIDLRNSKCRV